MRAVVSMVARYRSPTTFEYVEEECFDVSVGGMFIRSVAPAAAGTLLKLECESDVPGNKIHGVARVVWLRRDGDAEGPSGMGVKFVKLEGPSRLAIEEIVKRNSDPGPAPDPANDVRATPAPEVIDAAVVPRTFEPVSEAEASLDPVPSLPPEGRSAWKSWTAWSLGGMVAFGAIVSSDWFLGRAANERALVIVSPEIALESANVNAAIADQQSAKAAAVAAPPVVAVEEVEPYEQRDALQAPIAAAAVDLPSTPSLMPAAPEPIAAAAVAVAVEPEVPQMLAPTAAASPPAAIEPIESPVTGKTKPVSAAKPGFAKPLKPMPAKKPNATPRVPREEVAAAKPIGRPGGTPMELATACLTLGNNDCVIKSLDGKARAPREYELLIETLRSVGRSREAQKHMATYVARFPNETRATSYRRMLEAQQKSQAAAKTDAPDAP